MTAALIGLWDSQDADYFCLATKDKDGLWRDHFVTRADFGSLATWVRLRRDCNVYFCPHGYMKPIKKERHACDSHLLWADLDEQDPEDLAVVPTIAWTTSRGRYAAIWKCDGEPSRALRRGFNTFVKADRGWNLTKVLRLWGTVNYKRERPDRVPLLWDDGPIHKLRDLRLYEGEDDRGGDAGETPDVVLLNARSVLAKYIGKFDTDLMQVAIDGRNGTVKSGGRYRIIWKIGQTLKTLGASRDEIATLIWHSRAFKSKRRDHPNPFAALRDEVDRIMRKK